MRILRRISVLSAAILMCCGVFPATAVPDRDTDSAKEVLKRRFSERISLSYNCIVTANGTDVNLSGTLLLQGNCYYAKGNGLEIFSDAHTRWTVDRETMDVYIESSTGTEEVFMYENTIKELTLSDIRYFPANTDLSPFTFSTENLGSEWVVTDLREE